MSRICGIRPRGDGEYYNIQTYSSEIRQDIYRVCVCVYYIIYTYIIIYFHMVIIFRYIRRISNLLSTGTLQSSI